MTHFITACDMSVNYYNSKVLKDEFIHTVQKHWMQPNVSILNPPYLSYIYPIYFHLIPN